MSCKPRLAASSLLALMAIGGAARAQPLDLRLPPAIEAPPAVSLPTFPGAPVRPTPDLADPLNPLARPALQVNTMESAVFARTAIDHRLAGRENLTGSLGFLCGLQPAYDTGGAAAYGVDPHGRFVGAKFSLAFK